MNDQLNVSAPQPLLHVFLLTYNRQDAFRRTMEAIAASPLKEYPLTVMDNCSTDGTSAVCEEYKNILPRMTVVRHARNIGFGANYLRSIELSGGQYTWVLCDDDTLFPDRVMALLELLRDKQPAACFVGGPRQEEWPGGTGLSPREIQREFRTFITMPSFVPCIVFKNTLVGSAELVEAYRAISTNFPQMVLGGKLFLEDIPCAVMKPPPIQREAPAEKGTGHLDVAAGWSAFCHDLPREFRAEAYLSFFSKPTRFGMLTELLRMILWTKIETEGDPGYYIAFINLTAGYSFWPFLFLCRIACLVPAGLYDLARNFYRKIKYGWLGRPLPPTFHAPLCRDKLRR